MNNEFITKMMAAKKMEMDAFTQLMPPVLRPHIHNLQRELLATAVDLLTGGLTQNQKTTSTQKPVSKNITIL